MRGLRAVSDFEAELQMAHTNRKLQPGVDTVFLMSALDFGYLSSSLAKEVAQFGGEIAEHGAGAGRRGAAGSLLDAELGPGARL